MFHAVKGCWKVRTGGNHSSPYFPCRYLRRLVVAWMCHNRFMIWKLKRVSLESKYGVEGGDVCAHPISFKDYLRKLLNRSMWGDDVVLYSLSTFMTSRSQSSMHTPWMSTGISTTGLLPLQIWCSSSQVGTTTCMLVSIMDVNLDKTTGR